MMAFCVGTRHRVDRLQQNLINTEIVPFTGNSNTNKVAGTTTNANTGTNTISGTFTVENTLTSTNTNTIKTSCTSTNTNIIRNSETISGTSVVENTLTSTNTNTNTNSNTMTGGGEGAFSNFGNSGSTTGNSPSFWQYPFFFSCFNTFSQTIYNLLFTSY